MKGLLKNNLYATIPNAKLYSIFMFLVGVFVVAVTSQQLVIGYMMIGIIGFSANAMMVTKNEFVSKWGKYKLTVPVKRVDIVKSYFINMIIWLLVGMLFAGVALGLSWLLHGCPFDQPVDILTLFALGVSMSLFMGAMFFPLFCLSSAERSDVFLIITFLCALGIDLVIVTVTNELLEPGIRTVLLGVGVLLVCSLLAFLISYPITAGIFNRKEY